MRDVLRCEVIREIAVVASEVDRHCRAGRRVTERERTQIQACGPPLTFLHELVCLGVREIDVRRLEEQSCLPVAERELGDAEFRHCSAFADGCDTELRHDASGERDRRSLRDLIHERCE